jgi:ubiquinone/menaquinone biosynthesis C-methylase UbiE
VTAPQQKRPRTGVVEDFANPPRLFVFVDGVLAPRIFHSLYRRYAESIELKGDEAILDFGCGSGGIAENLVRRVPNGSVTCIDISPPMLAIASRRLRRYPNARCIVGRMEAIDLSAASFDVVVIHNALHDIPEPERSATVAEVARLLRPGGRLHFREPTDDKHGLRLAVYRELMHTAGLEEVRGQEKKIFPIGPVFDAVFAKPECQPGTVARAL